MPSDLRHRPLVGCRVVVPLGRSSRNGIVVNTLEQTSVAGIKPISSCLDVEPFLDDEVLELCRWAATYYMSSLAEVVATIVPTRLPRPREETSVRLANRLGEDEAARLRLRAPKQWAVYDALTAEDCDDPMDHVRALPDWLAAARRLERRGIVDIFRSEAPNRPDEEVASTPEAAPTIALNREQGHAAKAIEEEMAANRFRAFLLFGVTGSGKTNVYLSAARAALAASRSVLVLLPEIALTEEIAERFRRQFGRRVALLHSALTPRDRWSEWARVRRGEAPIVVGPRSALFSPLPRLGLIVVDEEHDSSYKQEEGVRYNGRDLAVVRARLAGCPVVLGSATPAVETFHHAESGRYTLLTLRERAEGRPLPTVKLVGTKGDPAATSGTLCSEELRRAIEANRVDGGQTLLFLNRRGFAHFVQCLACGSPMTCGSCSVSLTLHRSKGTLVCHHCGFTRAASLPCMECGESLARGRSPGTEQVDVGLADQFPSLRIARMDRDSTVRRGSQARLLREWHDGDIDVLVGTQMVTKGVDNPKVTLVGVLNADLSLNLPDFRAAERTLQLVTQVAGRAGRGERPGTVVVQTLRPDHYSLKAAAAHDYRAFYEAEIDVRRVLGYPPFRRLVNVRLEAREESAAERLAREVVARLRDDARVASEEVQVVGPAPAPIERLRGWHRWQFMLRGVKVALMRSLLGQAMEAVASQRRSGRLRIIVDVDPYSML